MHIQLINISLYYLSYIDWGTIYQQDFSCAGVMYLCQFIEQNGGKLPERLEGPKVTTKRFGGQKFLQGLQLAIESGNYGKETIDSLINDSDSSDKINRSGSIKSVSKLLPGWHQG